MLYTDDLTIRVARDETLSSLVDYIVESERTETDWAERLEVLTDRFGLSYEDARLAVDRVGGGRARAANPANEPDRNKDPVAWISYRRHRGEPVPLDAKWPSAEDDRAATLLWQQAAAGEGSAQGTTSVSVVLRLFELTTAAMSTEHDVACKQRLLLQCATAVSTAAEACIDALGSKPCALEGSEAWADGVKLARCARRISSFFALAGAPEMELRALGLQGRIVTRMLGQSHAHVGRAMLDSAGCALRMNDAASAASFCEAVVADFARLVDEWEEDSDAPFDEHRLALECLLAALDVLTEGGHIALEHGELRKRCALILDKLSEGRTKAKAPR